ncbi:Leukotriene a-4 hydrolase hydrolase [Lasiodiplodia theobromae]|uniref:Leukotriene A(4) hydrolase n=1 Tax=Lasiodiplodia theobromae TaxID=45133 RepID=A0A5N5DT29_9PEZI|nr:Leukotriene a-4 hydrolase hydrolase [Lasiodiplodia theobromae]KAB2580102.1 Leukotriene A-4 hydrolase-like protein [Lasiodiplodia theobromae]KAF4546798.1 Leukotriene a-4 hydrolase hydrolase [Lasiodiplodia theobromae]
MVTRYSSASAVSVNKHRDPNTLSNYQNFLTKHTTVNFELDFAKQKLRGNVVLLLKSLTDKEADEVILDTSFLDIKEIKVDGKSAKWDLAARSEPYGSPLSIKLGEGVEKDKEIAIDISLSTTEQCTALQWLTPEQTSNKKHPYMFSQCQAIHARSVLPCQDTPDVKSTVDFNIRSPLPVLASGLPTGIKDFQPSKDGAPGTLLYTYKQEIPIPAYLIALASGDIASASIGPRSTVWTSSDALTACQWELEGDMEKFLEAAEKIVYDYAWTTYNVLVLPNSFPYGGMENPIYTFATPTIISGDKQNIDVIAHELAHSWSGNLVSNASWEHFWLNEGWTVYLERRIIAAIHGEQYRDFSAIIGWKALQDSVERYGQDHEYTKLITDLKGKDPDDAFSSIPYEKGSTFLYYLEKLLGKEKWDKFIPHYFKKYKYKSLDSYDFKATLIDFFASDKDASAKLESLDWDTWFYAPGYPPKPDFDDSLVKVCYELAERWEGANNSDDISGFKPTSDDIAGWTGNQAVVFLEKIQSWDKPLKSDLVELMWQNYRFKESANVEIVSRFLVLGLKSKTISTYQPTAELLGRVGRMKFVRPLFRALKDADFQMAKDTFERNKDFYHPICRAMVEKDLFGEQ